MESHRSRQSSRRDVDSILPYYDDLLLIGCDGQGTTDLPHVLGQVGRYDWVDIYDDNPDLSPTDVLLVYEIRVERDENHKFFLGCSEELVIVVI